jgi:hypothetical protein
MTKLTTIIGATLTLALGALGSAADARVIGGGSGKPQPGDVDCFTLNYSGITQNCAGTKAYEVLLVVDSPYTTSPFYSVSVPAGKRIGCNTVSMTQDHTGYWATPVTYNSVDGNSLISPGSVPVVLGGDLYATCFLDQGTTLNSANW